MFRRAAPSDAAGPAHHFARFCHRSHLRCIVRVIEFWRERKTGGGAPGGHPLTYRFSPGIVTSAGRVRTGYHHLAMANPHPRQLWHAARALRVGNSTRVHALSFPGSLFAASFCDSGGADYTPQSDWHPALAGDRHSVAGRNCRPSRQFGNRLREPHSQSSPVHRTWGPGGPRNEPTLGDSDLGFCGTG